MSASANGRNDSTTSTAREVRNVVVVGPQGAGKTVFIESLLFANKNITRLGSKTEGTSVADHTDVEKRLQRSVNLSVVTTEVNERLRGGPGSPPVTLTLLATPGHPDYVGEVRAGLRAGDAALFVISAIDGIDPGTAMLWRECALAEMPRAVVITHLDQQRASFTDVVKSARKAFGDGIQPLYIPHGEGTIAPLSRKVREGDETRRASDEEMADIEDLRGEIVEAIITESDSEGLLDRYLSGEDIPFRQLVDDLTTAVARASFFPVVPSHPHTGLGAREVMELITWGFPSPAQHHMPTAFTSKGAAADPIVPDADGPLIAEVIKTTTDAYVGRISVVRVFSGTLLPDTQVHISGHLAQFTGNKRDEAWHQGHDEVGRAGTISTMFGGKLTPVAKAEAGDIVAVTNLEAAETGDTLADPDNPVVIEPWVFPHPLLPVAIRAATSKDEDKLMRGLARLQAENPTAQVVVDSETGQLVLWTMGESQLELLLDMLKERDGVEVEIEPVRVAVQETVRAKATGIGRHVKQSGGHGQYAIAHVTIEPLPQGSGFEFVDEVVGGAVPRQFIPSVEKGIRTQMDKGVTGYPMVDFRIRLTGGKAHSVDSSDAAFQMAGALALKEAATAAGIQLLEPIDSVAITVDDEFVGAVMNDLASRRGRVNGTEQSGEAGRTTVTAHVPAFELVRYTQVLRSLARGSGEFTRAPDHYAPAPVSVQDRLTEVADG